MLCLPSGGTTVRSVCTLAQQACLTVRCPVAASHSLQAFTRPVRAEQTPSTMPWWVACSGRSDVMHVQLHPLEDQLEN